MKIIKLGHCCLVINHKGVKILTDPGAYTTSQNSLKGVEILVITHEHLDHFHTDSVKQIIENNPGIEIITNSAVDLLLKKAGISGVHIVEDGQNFGIKGINFLGCGKEHEEIFKERGKVMNTGYLIDAKLYYPGDSFFVPNAEVDVLALPVGGGWLRIKDAINFALNIKPKNVFPVHDIMYNEIGIAITERHPKDVLEENGVGFVKLEIGKEYEF